MPGYAFGPSATVKPEGLELEDTTWFNGERPGDP